MKAGEQEVAVEAKRAEANLRARLDVLPELRVLLERADALRLVPSILPGSVPAPSDAWRIPYEAMARDDQLRWTTLEHVTVAAKAFLDPVLTGGLDATWLPDEWRWS